MKRLLFILAPFLFLAFIACNEVEKKPEETSVPKKSYADSLYDEVMEGHNAAMPGWTKIPRLQKETKRLIDSISGLPVAAQKAAAPYKARLEGLLMALDGAYDSMGKWMDEFIYDALKGNEEQRIKYLVAEKLKVGKVKEAVLGSLQKADSLLKKKS